jgi:hypothetical protein
MKIMKMMKIKAAIHSVDIEIMLIFSFIIIIIKLLLLLCCNSY